jgi:hypothetical protein
MNGVDKSFLVNLTAEMEANLENAFNVAIILVGEKVLSQVGSTINNL